ncbi:Lrp/AsnC family transcriptional regulator [Streptomyces sp. NPDC058330]|uniref:Lrp/AsnC family transcriptional regulator n=1 Tax=Streptomyces sp. NPDC058330 TaxID=3346449 RepID=UPI0036EE0090
MTESLDVTDWAILAELQQDGRVAFTELARRVNLSASATKERVRRLEAAGVITGFRAEVDLERTGYAILAVVRLKYPGPGTRHEPLRRLIEERSEILECLRTTGDDCYVMKVATTSMAHLEEIVDALAQFGSTTTNLVLSRTQPFRGPREPGARTAGQGLPRTTWRARDDSVSADRTPSS